MRTITGMILVLVCTIAAPAQFTGITNDFSSTVSPFEGTAAIATTDYASAPSSMRITHGLAKSSGAYNGTVVQTGFWTGKGFPTVPIRFYCMLKDSAVATANHNMDIHMNYGTTQNGYTWLGMYYFTKGPATTEWTIGMDETLDDIGSMGNAWQQENFAELYLSRYGSFESGPPIVLTLIIECRDATIFVDDLSIEMQETGAERSAPLHVTGVRPVHQTHPMVLVTPTGRKVQASPTTAHGLLVGKACAHLTGSTALWDGQGASER